ncbi:NADP-dependent oxidoreductase domain-containing protein [Dactylonectria macrodidyma]|uniref:NADP-dependent oxidoreductase domain-containing protein n=1 Tax=Dactylonectria macrodidyma TaxID=307937 RepID=A0A9P9IUH4_9HYPO|nr:NADP-dependent oxidoreductase domain-containing protein [Dactylonectria macrodidyma]
MLRLNDGNAIPMLAYGLGTALYKTSKDEKDEDVLHLTSLAIENGYYHLDGAELYNNEEELGDAVRASKVAREELFVVTKLCGTEKRDVQSEFDNSLTRLGLDYVNLYLIHGPFMADTAEELQEIWSKMEAIKRSGKAKSIGVSNFLQEHLEIILETAEIPPAINSIEYHPYLQRGNLVEFHWKNNIAVSAYSTLTALVEGSPGPVDGIYKRLAGKYGVTEGDVALRWCIDQGIVAVTTSRSLQRLKGYMENISTFELKKEEIKQISDAGKRKHYRKFLGDRFDPDDRR